MKTIDFRKKWHDTQILVAIHKEWYYTMICKERGEGNENTSCDN